MSRIEHSGVTRLVEDGGQYFLRGAGGVGPSIKYQGAAITLGQFGGWSVIGAEQMAGGYQIVFKNGGADQYVVWALDANGHYASTVTGIVSGADAGLQALETAFQQDLNGNGQIGLATTVVEDFGATRLVEGGGQYFLHDAGGVGPSIKYQGAAITLGQFGGWSVIGAEQMAGGYQIVFKNGAADQYVVWALDANGHYASTVTGIVSGADAGLQALETAFQQDLNGNGQIGLATTVVEDFGATRLVEGGGQYFLHDAGGVGPSIKYQGAAITLGQFGGWSVIGAEQMAGGYQIVFKNGAADQYVVWALDANGHYASTVTGIVSGADAGLQALETAFQQDLNGNGQIGLATTVVEDFGATRLVEGGGQYFLHDAGGVGPSIKYQGAAITLGQFGGWSVIGAEQMAGGYQIVFKNGAADQYVVWALDANGHYASTVTGIVSGADAGLQALETAFQQDLNGNGQIGLATTVIEDFGATHLVEGGGQYFLHDAGGVGPSIKYQGVAITLGQFGGWSVIGAEQMAGGYQIVFKNGAADQYVVWALDANGHYASTVTGIVSGADAGLQALETAFQQDLNGNGQIGLATTVVEDFGATRLVEGGGQYFLHDAGGVGPSIKYQGVAITLGQFGGWSVIGAEQMAGGYQIVFKNGAADQYVVWALDANGHYASTVTGIVSGADTGLQMLETVLQQDLNGSGWIGLDNGTPTLASTTIAASELNALDAATSASIDASSVRTLIGTASEVLTAFASPGIFGLGSASVTLTDVAVAASDLLAIDAVTSGLIDTSTVTTVIGIWNDILAAFNSIGSGLSGNEDIILLDSLIAASDLNAIDVARGGLIDVSYVATVTGTLADVAALYQSQGIIGLENATVTLTDTVVAASELDLLDALTNGTIDASSVLILTGAASEVAAACASPGIVGLDLAAVTLTDVAVAVADLIAIDATTSGTIDATSVTVMTGTAYDAQTAYASLEIAGLDAVTLVLTDAAIAASDLNLLDAVVNGTIDASLVTAMTGTLLEALTVYGSPGIVGLAGATVTLSDTVVTASDLNLLDAAAGGTIDAASVTSVTGTAFELALAFGSPGITGLALAVATLTDADVVAADLNTIDLGTSGILDATSVTRLTGTALDAALTLASPEIVGLSGVPVTLTDVTVAAGDLDALDAVADGTIDASLVATVTGTASEAVTAYGSAGIIGLEAAAVGLTDGVVAAASLSYLDDRTSGAIDASLASTLVGTAVAVEAAYFSSGIIGLGDEAVLLSGTVASAASLNAIDASTSGMVDASAVLAVTGTVSNVAAAYGSAEISGLGDESVILSGAVAAALDLNTINRATSGTVNMASILTLVGSLSDLNETYSAAGFSGRGNEAVTLVDPDATTTALIGLDGKTTGLIDASSVTTLTGTVTEVASVLGAIGIGGLGNASLHIIGTPLADTINGGAHDDVLSGLGGNDTLDGRAGADTMIGGLGNDEYLVEDAGDLAVELAGQGIDSVRSWIDYTIGSNIENLALQGAANLNGTGNELNNVLVGNSGQNILDGGLGSDTLSGQGGGDTFRFSTAIGLNNVDDILSFDHSVDTIQLTSAVFTLLPAGNLAAGAFNTGSVATEADDRILYDPVSGGLYYDGDGVGGAVGVKFATISVMTGTIDHTDFFVV